MDTSEGGGSSLSTILVVAFLLVVLQVEDVEFGVILGKIVYFFVNHCLSRFEV